MGSTAPGSETEGEIGVLGATEIETALRSELVCEEPLTLVAVVMERGSRVTDTNMTVG